MRLEGDIVVSGLFRLEAGPAFEGARIPQRTSYIHVDTELVGVIGVCLLATGLLVSLLLFGGSSTGPNRPTVFVSTALAPPQGIRIPSVGLPTPPP